MHHKLYCEYYTGHALPQAYISQQMYFACKVHKNISCLVSELLLHSSPPSFQVETWPAQLSQVTPLTSPPLGKAAIPPQHLLEWFLVSHITGFMMLLSLSGLIIFSVSSPQQLTIFSKPEFNPKQYKVLEEMFDSRTFNIPLRLTTKLKCQVKIILNIYIDRIILTMLSTVGIRRAM